MHLLIYLLLLYLITPYKAYTESTVEKEHALFQQCATDICGPANRDLFGPDNEYLNFLKDNQNFDKTVTVNPEISSKFSKNIQPIIIKALQNLKGILNTLKNTLQNLNSGNHELEWDRIAKEIALYYTTDTEDDTFSFKKPESKSDDQRQLFFINKLKKIKVPPEQTTFSCSESICRKMVKEELLHLQANLEKSIQTAENNRDQYLKYCESIYAIIITQDQQIKAYKENLEKYKDRFLNTVFADYSMESRELFTDYINNTLTIKIHETDGEQRFINDINKIAKKNPQQTFSFTNATNNLPKHASVCSPYIALLRSYSSNFFVKGKDKILTGFRNYFFPEHGKQMFIHELAHALSEQFMKGRLSQPIYKQYGKLRTCATKRFKFDNTDSAATEIYFATRASQIVRTHPYHENDKLSTEEDTADLTAYKVFQDEPTIALCLLIGPSPSRKDTQYDNFRMISLGGSYSPSLFRIIMEVIHKRIELPKSCQQVVDTYSDRINFDPCF